MPIISLVFGYNYLIFGSYHHFSSLGFTHCSSLFLSTFLAIISGLFTFYTAKWNSLAGLFCPQRFALQQLLTHFVMTLNVLALLVLTLFASNFATKTLTVFLFWTLAYLLNLGPVALPAFSVSDPFYWAENERMLTQNYDQALKTVLLAGFSYLSAYLSPFYHAAFTTTTFLFDLFLIAHYWDINGMAADPMLEEEFDDSDEEEEEEPSIIEDLHLD